MASKVIALGSRHATIHVSRLMEGTPEEVIENDRGSRTTPRWSLSARIGERFSIGQAANSDRLVTNPENTIFAIKRLIGPPLDDPIVEKRQGPIVPTRSWRRQMAYAWVRAPAGKRYSPRRSRTSFAKNERLQPERYLRRQGVSGSHHRAGYFKDRTPGNKGSGTIAAHGSLIVSGADRRGGPGGRRC